MQFTYRQFIAPKEGLSASSCDDNMAADPARGIFAVADGVSRSYRPDLLSRLLAQSYVDADSSGCFGLRYATGTAQKVAGMWKASEEAEYEAADQRKKFRLDRRREEFGFAGSTLAGIKLTPECFAYDVIGDSCVFLIPDPEEDVKPAMITSMLPDPADGMPDSRHPFAGKFGSRPHCLLSDGRMIGGFVSGSVAPFRGVVMLMTDALADWFARSYDSADPWALAELLSLTEATYPEFLSRHRDSDMADDDSTLIIIEITDAAGVETVASEAGAQPDSESADAMQSEVPGADAEPEMPVEPAEEEDDTEICLDTEAAPEEAADRSREARSGWPLCGWSEGIEPAAPEAVETDADAALPESAVSESSDPEESPEAGLPPDLPDGSPEELPDAGEDDERNDDEEKPRQSFWNLKNIFGKL